MNIYLIIAIVFFLSVLLFWISIIIKISKKKNLNIERKRYYKKIIKQLSVNLSNKEKIIDYDKTYHKVLQDLWYVWTFWQILKQAPIEIHDINKVWALHKIRNKLVHDFDLLSESILKKNASDYKKELEKIIN